MYKNNGALKNEYKRLRIRLHNLLRNPSYYIWYIIMSSIIGSVFLDSWSHNPYITGRTYHAEFIPIGIIMVVLGVILGLCNCSCNMRHISIKNESLVLVNKCEDYNICIIGDMSKYIKCRKSHCPIKTMGDISFTSLTNEIKIHEGKK